jgi:hypothetical protein
MSERPFLRLAAVALYVALVAACGGSDSVDPPAPTPPTPPPVSPPSTPEQTPSAYLQTLPQWVEFSPPVAAVAPTKIAETAESKETIDNVPVIDPTTKAVIGYRTEDYTCASTSFSMKDTPEKIAMFSPDREILWPGALIQGRSHRDGVGSLLPLVIGERTAIKVSIPSLATSDNFRVVDTPDQAEVNQAIGSMVSNATTANLVTPSTIQFLMEDYDSEESFALKSKLSGKYLGFRASASASVDRKANERTVMVYFYEKMFEVVVEPPQTPGSFFSEAFTREKLDEQIAMGRIGPDNPPVYLSNVVYGRMMAFTFTSTASSSEIRAALNASYKGIFSANFSVDAEHAKILNTAKITVTSLGGSTKASVAMIASGDWRDYFKTDAPLTTAYPISYTFRNLGDGSIASVAEGTKYTIKECQLDTTAFTGFVLDSFETDVGGWTAQNPPLVLDWGKPTTPQSVFYGYIHAQHTNELVNANFLYDVGYIAAPAHFEGAKSDFYRGELTFWYKPEENLINKNTGIYCYQPPAFFLPRICWTDLVVTSVPLSSDFKVKTDDSVTTFDQVVLRGGTPPFAILTLTYNPIDVEVPREWKKHAFALTNDPVRSACDPATSTRGCWMVEEKVATEEQIRYVLSNVTDLRIRASYPVTRRLCTLPTPGPADMEGCTDWVHVPYGYVGGYFDEVKLSLD